MDRQPLLSSSYLAPAPESSLPQGRQSARGPSAPEDDENRTHSTTPEAGATSDVRCSFFSSLSLSLWSDSVALRESSTQRYTTQLLLRPFRRLMMLLRRHRCCCCCSCLGCAGCWPWLASSEAVAESGYREGNEEVGDDRGVEHAADRGRRTFTTTSPGGSAGSHRRRQYVPPRSQSADARPGEKPSAVPPPPMEQPGATGDGPILPHSDSWEGNSWAGSSTPPSSLSLGRSADRRADIDGGHLVMQRGILMRMAADGTCTRVPESASFANGGHHTSAGLGGHRYGIDGADRVSHRDERGTPQVEQPELFSAAHLEQTSTTATPVTAAGTVTGDERQNPYEVAILLDAMEASRRRLQTLEQLTAALTPFASYLPVRIEVEADLNSSRSLPEHSNEDVETASSAPSPFAVPPSAPPLPLCVHVLGPVRPFSVAQVLRSVEDMLLEDCDSCHLRLTALHCADLDLRRVHLGEGRAVLHENSSLPYTDVGTLESRVQSNAYLDLLISPDTDHHVTHSGRGRGGGNRRDKGEQDGNYQTRAEEEKAMTAHVLSFVKHVITGRSPHLTTLHFTRCYMVAHDLGLYIPLPLATVRRLRFEHCLLTPAHMDALLTLARQQDALACARLAETQGGSAASAQGSRSFSMLEELHLSGSLTPESITELLDYLEDQQRQCEMFLKCGGTFGHESEAREANRHPTGRRHHPQDMAEVQASVNAHQETPAYAEEKMRRTAAEKRMNAAPSFMDRMYDNNAAVVEPTHATRRRGSAPQDHLNIFSWEDKGPAGGGGEHAKHGKGGGPRAPRSGAVSTAPLTAEDRRAQESKKFETNDGGMFLHFSDAPKVQPSCATGKGHPQHVQVKDPKQANASKEAGMMGSLLREQPEKPRGRRVHPITTTNPCGVAPEALAVAGFPGIGQKSAPRGVPHLTRKPVQSNVFPPSIPSWAQERDSDDGAPNGRVPRAAPPPAPTAPATAALPTHDDTYRLDEDDYEDYYAGRMPEAAKQEQRPYTHEIEMGDDDYEVDAAPISNKGGAYNRYAQGGKPDPDWLQGLANSSERGRVAK